VGIQLELLGISTALHSHDVLKDAVPALLKRGEVMEVVLYMGCHVNTTVLCLPHLLLFECMKSHCNAFTIAFLYTVRFK